MGFYKNKSLTGRDAIPTKLFGRYDKLLSNLDHIGSEVVELLELLDGQTGKAIGDTPERIS